MKQILQSYRTGELWLAEVPAPALDDQSVLIRTSHSVVSAGTERMVLELAKKSLLGKARARPDLVKKVIQKIKTEGLRATLEKTFAKLDTPTALGYSASGVVVQCGLKVHEFQPGDRVACAGAGYATHAEYNVVPRNLCVKLPDGVSYEDGSFATLGAIAMQGVRQADVRLGERVAVVGLGLLGLLTVQLLKASGCAVLGIDLDPDRCKLAASLGADRTAVGSGIAQAEALSQGHGLDAVLLTAATSSNQPIEEAAEMLRMRGRVVVVGVVGMNIPRDSFYKKELELRLSMSYGPGRYDANYEERGIDYPYAHVRWTEQRNMQCFLEQVDARRVTPGKLVTHRYPVDQGLSAYELFEGASNTYLGITLSYGLPEPPAQLVIPERRVQLPATTSVGGVGIGLIGAGNYAKAAILPALKKLGANLVGICTTKGMNATEVGKKYGFQYATTDPDQLLKDKNIGALIVCTRHDSHADYVMAGLRAGKHVFVEKPLCLTLPDLQSVREVVSELGVRCPVLTVGFNRRFSRHTTAIQTFFAKRTRPLFITYRINAGRIPLDTWIQHPDEGGGRILGEVCHFVDWCQAVVGRAVVSVSANRTSLASATDTADDGLALRVCYDDGSLASISYVADGAHNLPKEHVEAHGGGRSIVLDDFRRTDFYGSRQAALRGPQAKGAFETLAAFLTATQAEQPPIPVSDILETTYTTLMALAALRHRAHEGAAPSSPAPFI